MNKIKEIDQEFEKLFDSSPLANIPKFMSISKENIKLAMKGCFYAGYAFCQTNMIENDILGKIK